MTEQKKLENGRFSAKIEKGGPHCVNGPDISQSDCMKAGQYKLPSDNNK